MADARDRALTALVDLLIPAAALGVKCGECDSPSGKLCVQFDAATGYRSVWPWVHSDRLATAGHELRQHLKVLLELG